MSKKVRRLYDQFKSDHYILNLVPDRENMSFSGTVIITGHKIGRPSQRLSFHQKGLKITHAHLIKHDKHADQELSVDRINHHAAYDEVRLHSGTMLYPGRYTVTLEFKGFITKQMNGIYPCFFEHEGKQKMLIATQFESHHAREAFPCIDEPAAKATFDLTLTVPAEETVLANTPVKNRQPVAGTKNLAEVSFETTPTMSTYLLAFAFGELDYLEAKTKNGVTVRTYATPDNARFTQFALDTAVKCLEFYNDYFDIPYPLEKCDMVALPDFASGAMENWGLITYREQTLLVDPANTSLSTKQYVAMVVAHELAHQWFGNLVTMRWWTDLWLNEGFASWIEYLAVDHLFPDWDMWTQFIASEQQQAFKLDSLENTHPIEVVINHPDEIRTIFDTISYAKGASVIHMLHDYLGAEDFKNGLRYYLKKHEYSNTDTVDLWDALEEVSGKPVRNFMHAWTSRGGYPLLHATVDEEKDVLHLRQERFYLNPEHRNNHHQPWPIALLGGAALPETIEKSELSLRISSKQLENFKLNQGQSGFYRVVYSPSHDKHLGERILRGKMKPLDRLGLLSDSFEAVKAGYEPTTEALAVMEYYKEEDNAAVWDIIAANIGAIRSVMDDDELREDMKPYVRNLAQKQCERLGWESKKNESHFDRLLRPTILSLSSFGNEPSVVKEALHRFKTMKKPEDINPDLRSVVYSTAVYHGGHAEFEKLLKMHTENTSSEEKVTIAAALTGFKQPELIKRALKLITTDEVRLQDAPYWVAYSFMNRHAKYLTWDWMVDNWKWLDDNLGTDLSFYRMPIYAARCFSNRDFLPVFKKFFKGVNKPGLERSINQGVEMIEWQSAWRDRDLKEIKAFFKSRV